MGIQIDNPLGTQKVSSLLHRFALPSIVAMLVSSLYNIVDQFFYWTQRRRTWQCGNQYFISAFYFLCCDRTVIWDWRFICL